MPRALIHPLPLILASGSESRKKLLTQSGLDFNCINAPINEAAILAKTPQDRVKAIAKAKCEAVLPKLERPALILAADTIAICNREILEKPRYKMTAVEMLKKLNGTIHTLLTGWVVFNSYKDIWHTGFSETYITFRKLTHHEIVKYVDDNPVTDWAGAYNSQLSSAITFIDKIDGSLTGANGLPLEQVIPILKHEWDNPYIKRPS